MKTLYQAGIAAIATLAALFAASRMRRQGGDLGAGGGEPAGPAGEPVDPYAPWETSKDGDCDPTPKPGVLAFRSWVLGKWGEKPGSPTNIVRACDVGKASEHKEGRAWDLMTLSVPHGQSIIDALMAPDPVTGEPHALARRAGVMYAIWNHQMWRAYPWQGQPSGTWSPYSAGEAASPHVDHIHFSFSKDGAMGKTSLYRMLGTGAIA